MDQNHAQLARFTVLTVYARFTARTHPPSEESHLSTFEPWSSGPWPTDDSRLSTKYRGSIQCETNTGVQFNVNQRPGSSRLPYDHVR